MRKFLLAIVAVLTLAVCSGGAQAQYRSHVVGGGFRAGYGFGYGGYRAGFGYHRLAYPYIPSVSYALPVSYSPPVAIAAPCYQQAAVAAPVYEAPVAVAAPVAAPVYTAPVCAPVYAASYCSTPIGIGYGHVGVYRFGTGHRHHR